MLNYIFLVYMVIIFFKLDHFKINRADMWKIKIFMELNHDLIYFANIYIK